MHRKNIVSNIFEKHLLAHCVLWSTTMDQNTRVIYSNARKSDQFEQHAIVRLPSSVEHNRTHYKVLSIDHSIAGHLFADYERDAGSNKIDQKLIRKFCSPLKFISHAWPPIVIQKTAKQTFGEAPMTGNVLYSRQVSRSQTCHSWSRWPAQLQWKAHQGTPMQVY